ncbi:MAG: ABC transporter ATP-binding protein [Clostridia bacterium]
MPDKIVRVYEEKLLRPNDVDKTPVLQTRELGIDFGGLTAVNDFTVSIGRTEICGLIGPNGAGKTTIFNLLTSVYEPTRGAVIVDGKDIKGKKVHQVNKMGIARTFQNIRLFSKMSVLDNVKIGLTNGMKTSMLASFTHLFGYKKEEKRANQKAMELLAFFDMQDKAKDLAGSLPYGDQRRLEIIRALATNPCVLLLDEPAAGMNPSETAALMDNIRRIRDEFQIAVVLIEHDMNLVMGICETIAVINYGQIIAKGTAEEIQNNPAVIEAYLGKKVDE